MTQLIIPVRDAADAPLAGVTVVVRKAVVPVTHFIRYWHGEFVRMRFYDPTRALNYYVFVSDAESVLRQKEPVTQGMWPGMVWYPVQVPLHSIVIEVWDPPADYQIDPTNANNAGQALARYKAGDPPNHTQDMKETDGTWVVPTRALFNEGPYPYPPGRALAFGVGWTEMPPGHIAKDDPEP